MDTWPSNISILRQDFNETAPNRVIRSQMDVGPAKVRRRTTSAVKNISFKMMLNNDDYSTVYDFYLDNDSIPFTFVHPITSESLTARFTAPLQSNNNGTLWNVSVQLEILP